MQYGKSLADADL